MYLRFLPTLATALAMAAPLDASIVLQPLVDATAAGGTLNLNGAETYTGDLLVSKNMTINGHNATILLGSGGASTSANVTIKNATIKGGANNFFVTSGQLSVQNCTLQDANRAAALSSSTTASFQGCVLQNFVQHAVSLDGSNATLTITGGSVLNSGGVVVSGGSGESATISGVTVSGCPAGINLSHATVTLSNNSISGTSSQSALTFDDCTVTSTNDRLTNCSQMVQVTGASHFTGSGGTITTPAGAGVGVCFFAASGSIIDLTGYEIAGGLNGIDTVDAGTFTTIRDSWLHDNGFSAFIVKQGSGASIDNCLIERTIQDGAYFEDCAHSTMTNCIVRDSGQPPLASLGQTDRVGTGIAAVNAADVVIEGNVVTGSWDAGIAVTDTAHGVIRRNSLRSNLKSGIQVSDNTSFDVIGNVICEHTATGQAGIYLLPARSGFAGSRTLIDRNLVLGNLTGLSRAAPPSGAGATVARSIISYSLNNNVYLGSTGTASFTGSDFTGASRTAPQYAGGFYSLNIVEGQGTTFSDNWIAAYSGLGASTASAANQQAAMPNCYWNTSSGPYAINGSGSNWDGSRTAIKRVTFSPFLSNPGFGRTYEDGFHLLPGQVLNIGSVAAMGAALVLECSQATPAGAAGLYARSDSGGLTLPGGVSSNAIIQAWVDGDTFDGLRRLRAGGKIPQGLSNGWYVLAVLNGDDTLGKRFSAAGRPGATVFGVLPVPIATLVVKPAPEATQLNAVMAGGSANLNGDTITDVADIIRAPRDS